jgi:1-deoxyxylulose-5-phosphate synthase
VIFWYPKLTCAGLSRKHIFEAVEASLKRLETDYVDVLQIHRYDYETPREETMKALHGKSFSLTKLISDLVEMGKVRYIGASSMFAYQFLGYQHVAQLHGWTKFISMQNYYNLLYREEEREMLPACKETGVGYGPRIKIVS